MHLSQAVTSDLDGYLRRFKRPEEYRPKVLKIIEMSKEGRTLEEIKNAVRMSRGNINSARKWGRQAGLW
jgi:hypothetical protein